MSNIKGKIFSKIGILTILLLSSLIVVTTIITTEASSVNNADTVGDLIDCTRSDDWYSFTPGDVIGNKITAGIDEPTSQAGGYCIDSHEGYSGLTYKVVNIFDINNNTSANTVKVYSESNKSGTEYSVSNENVRPILMLAYLAQKGNDQTSVTTGSYKDCMARVFWYRPYVEKMLKVGMSDFLVPSYYRLKNENDVKAQAKMVEAINAAEKMANEGSIEGQSLTDVMSDDEDKEVTVTVNNGKTIIGPYKVGLSGECKIGEITVDGVIASGISTSKNADDVKSVENVKDSTNFYIVVNKELELTESSKITVKSKDAVTSTKARLLLVSGGKSQNFIIYRGSETSEYLTLNLAVPKYGSLQIKKTDKSSGNVLEGIGFKIYNSSKKLWVKQDETEITFVTFDNATEFKTDSKGYTKKIDKLPLGSYIIYETSLPDDLQDYYSIGTIKITNSKTGKEETKTAKKIKEVSIDSSSTVTVEATNTKAYRQLQILKQDESSKKNLSGVGFKVYSKVDEKTGWIQVDSNNKVTGYTDDINKASQFITDTNGLTEIIYKVPVGEYMIVETSLGQWADYYELGTFRLNGGNITGNIINESFKVTASGNSEPVKVTGYNKQDYGKLQVYKKDKTTESPLEGIGFKVYSAEKGWLIMNTSTWAVTGYTDSFDNATTIYTGSDGKTPEISKVPLGSGYFIYETYLPDELTYIYKLDDISVPRMAGGTTVKAKLLEDENGNTNLTVEEGLTTTSTYTLYNEQELISISGKVWEDIPQGKTLTDDDRNNEYDSGDYLVNGITVNLMKNGEKVDTCVTGINGKSSGEYKFDKLEINSLSDYYVEFTYDGILYQNVVTNLTNIENGSKASETTEHRNEFNNAFQNITGEGQTIKLFGKTITLEYETDNDGNVKLKDSCNKEKTGDNVVTVYDYDTYAITSDTNSAGLDLNTYYKDNKDKGYFKKNDIGLITEITNINLGLYEREQADLSIEKDVSQVKLSINGFNHVYKYGRKTEEYYEKTDSNFNVGVQFKKELTGTYTRPIYRSDIDYTSSDSSKELKVSIVYEINIRNEATNLQAKVYRMVEYYDADYGTIVAAGRTLSENGEITEKLNVVSQDGTYGEDGKYKKATIVSDGGIDVGSLNDTSNKTTIYVQFDLSRAQVAELLSDGEEPLDNYVEISSYTSYKDGSAYATVDKDSIPNNAIVGTVREDDEDNAPTFKLTLADSARNLSGTVFEDEAISSGTGNIRQGNATLDENEKKIANVTVTMTRYDENGNAEETKTTTTDENGNYSFEGYIPGYYKISFDWGENQGGYNVKDYKGTIYVSHSEDWYKVDDPRYSDALDDYSIREKIDNGDSIDTMTSTTPQFALGVEKDGTVSEEDIVTTTTDGDEFKPKAYNINNVDFGIIERARQELQISKNVKTVKITDTSGRTIVDATVNDEGKLEGQIEGVTCMVNTEDMQGYVKAELDSEIIQGSTIEIGYEIRVDNKSELDYDSKEYYLYGTQTGDVIKLKADNIYDYLDSELTVDTSKDENSSWTLKDATEVTSENETYTEKYFTSGIQTETQEDGTIVTKSSWSMSSSRLVEKFTEWVSDITATKTVRAVKIADKTILATQLSEALEPNTSKSVSITATKILANTDDINLSNDAEITEMSVEGKPGRNVKYTNYRLYDYGEDVIVTPPTGENKDYTMIIVLSVTAIAILGAGIIFIKKKVLNGKA